jgi:hypothetical protein
MALNMGIMSSDSRIKTGGLNLYNQKSYIRSFCLFLTELIVGYISCSKGSLNARGKGIR